MQFLLLFFFFLFRIGLKPRYFMTLTVVEIEQILETHLPWTLFGQNFRIFYTFELNSDSKKKNEIDIINLQ